jgi:PKD repeat protein
MIHFKIFFLSLTFSLVICSVQAQVPSGLYGGGIGRGDIVSTIVQRFAPTPGTPINLYASSNPVCNSGLQNVILTQQGGSLTGLAHWQWYSDSTYLTPVGAPLFSADASLTVSPLVTTTYYIRSEGPGVITPANGPAEGITITVYPPPTIITTGNAEAVCSGGNMTTTTLSYSATTNSPTSYMIDWDLSATAAGFSDQAITPFAFESGGGVISNIAIPAGISEGDYSGSFNLTNANGCPTSFEIHLSIAGIQANAGFITATFDSVCRQESTKLILHGNSEGVIQWYAASGNGNFTMLQGANSPEYLTTEQTETSYYYVVVGQGSCADTTAIFEVFVSEGIPQASFTYEQGNGYLINFSNTSINGSSYFWDFGANVSSTEINPEFTFPFEGSYPVTLIVSNGCGRDTFTLEVIVLKRVGIDQLPDVRFVLSPNPFRDFLNIKFSLDIKESLSLTIYDVIGHLIYTQEIAAVQENNYQLNTSGLSEGIYYLNLKTSKMNFNYSMIKIH